MRLCDVTHRALAEPHPGAGGINAHVETRGDPQFLLGVIIRCQFPTGDSQQLDRAMQHRVQHFREFQLAGQIGERVEERLLLFRTAALRCEQSRILDSDRGLRREQIDQTESFVAERMPRIRMHGGNDAHESRPDEERRRKHRLEGGGRVFL